jgi:glycosyltransferase involved in cell wall biosynthesis
MKTAIVYDWIDKQGGVERMLPVLAELLPEAHWFTSVYDSDATPWAKNLRITSSFMQRLPRFIKKSRLLSMPFYPYAFESFDFSGYDLVVSVTSSFAKSVITRPPTRHICYMLTPTRYLWGQTADYINTPIKKVVSAPYLQHLRVWDEVAAARPDKIVTLSHHIQKQIETYYHRDSEVVYPPFDLEYWQNLEQKPVDGLPEDFYLYVGRLEPYKRADIAIQAARSLKKHLVLVGSGSQKARLEAAKSKNTIFLSDLTDAQLAFVYHRAQALLMPQSEDFGLTSLEAQAVGCPVISFARSGAAETILPEKTGILFENQTAGGLVAAIERWESMAYNRITISNGALEKHLLNFSKKRFLDLFESALKPL